MLATDLQAFDGNFVFMDKRKKTPKRRVKKKCFKSPASSSTRQSLLKSRVLFKHDKKELELAAKVALRAKVATLHSLGLSERKIEKLVGKSRCFVRTWKNETCFLDKPGRGRKRTSLTPTT